MKPPVLTTTDSRRHGTVTPAPRPSYERGATDSPLLEQTLGREPAPHH